MAKKKVDNKNGSNPAPANPDLIEAPWEQPELPTGKSAPHQTDWAVDELGEPVPVEPAEVQAEQTSWNEAVATLEEDAKWDGSNLPTDPNAPDSLPEDTTDWDASQLAVDPQAGIWDAGSPATLTLNIETHSGSFNADTPKILIFGETGTEKTRLASTFPNTIFADVDHGMSSVTEQVNKVFIPDDETGFKMLQKLYDYLVKGNHGYETVVLDTLNEMQRVIMRFTVEEYTHIRRSYGNLPGQSDYGKMLYEFMELTRAFISLPMKVVLLAQVKSIENEGDVVSPQLIGKNTARELARKMDVIGYIYKAESEEGTHPEITFDAVNFITKDRSNKLPAALPYPSYSRIAAYWK